MAGKVFVFFNCDENKTESSMNIFYNNVTFKDTVISRNRLLNKINTEYKAGRVQIAEEDFPKIEAAIKRGNPVDAGNFMKYGAIKSFDCV